MAIAAWIGKPLWVQQDFLARSGVPLLARERPIRPALLADGRAANVLGKQCVSARVRSLVVHRKQWHTQHL